MPLIFFVVGLMSSHLWSSTAQATIVTAVCVARWVKVAPASKSGRVRVAFGSGPELKSRFSFG
jgi:hypothetical protein